MKTASIVMAAVALLAATATAQEIPKVKARPKPSPSAPRVVRDTPKAAATASLVVTCDAACELDIDGTSQGSLAAQETKVISVDLEEHLVKATSTEDRTVVWNKAVSIAHPGKKVVIVELARELQARRAQVAAHPSAVPADRMPPIAPIANAPAPPAPRELYSQAYADYARGNFDLAIQEYEEYLRAYPETDLADNAQYWIGECLFSKQKYEEALAAWDELFRRYPGSDKLPDARYKKGMALERLGRRSQALIEFRAVADRYPNSEAGRKAREKLNQ